MGIDCGTTVCVEAAGAVKNTRVRICLSPIPPGLPQSWML
jgi:hypothetical protein